MKGMLPPLLAFSLFCAAASTAGASETAPASTASTASKAAEKTCTTWDLSGDWTFFQSNEASPIFHLELTDQGLQGTGEFFYLVDSEPCPFFAQCGKDAVVVNSSVDGTLTGNELELTAYWSDGTIGVYSGKVNPQGRIEGTTFDREHPQTMASWYSARTANCLDGTGKSGGAVGSTSSALKTGAPPRPVRVAGRDGNVQRAVANKVIAIPVCDAAKNARVAKSPAAYTLDGMCRRQVNVATAAATTPGGLATSTRVTRVDTKTSSIDRVNTSVRGAAGSTVASGRIATTPADAAAVAHLPYSLLQKDSRFGTVAAPGVALGRDQPANSISVRVAYPKLFGYKTKQGPDGILGPSSCDEFGVSAIVGDGSAQRANPVKISTDWLMADAGDSYICSFLVSDLPIDQPVNVTVDVRDRVGPWLGDGQIQPPPGEQRVITNGSQTVTLKGVQNRARLTYQMGYGPLPGH
jgi:hypothetical protein